MKEAMKSAPRIDEEVAGTPVEAHGYIVTPVARVRGMVGSQETEQSSGRYGWAAIRPLKMAIQDRTVAIHEVRLVNVEAQAMTALAVVGGVVTLVALLLSILVRARKQTPAPTEG